MPPSRSASAWAFLPAMTFVRQSVITWNYQPMIGFPGPGRSGRLPLRQAFGAGEGR